MSEQNLNGMITAVHRERYEVLMKGETEPFFARLKTANYFFGDEEMLFPAVGDRVELELNPLGDSLIIKTMERKSCFMRKNPTIGMPEQVLAANFDYVFIVMSLNYDFNISRMERYIAAAWQSGGTPVVILSKADLCENGEEKIQKAKAAAIGVDVWAISALTGEGLEDISRYLKPEKIIAFLGSSGVGKSTFVNALMGEEKMDTGEIREDDSRGRHTTTHRQLLQLPNGAFIIDTPGMRELGMSDASEGVSQTFEDVEQLMLRCRYSNCSHKSEKGCAVREALENGELSEKRWNNYLKLKAEAVYAKKREQYLEKKRVKSMESGKKSAPRKKRFEIMD